MLQGASADAENSGVEEQNNSTPHSEEGSATATSEDSVVSCDVGNGDSDSDSDSSGSEDIVSRIPIRHRRTARTTTGTSRSVKSNVTQPFRNLWTPEMVRELYFYK